MRRPAGLLSQMAEMEHSVMSNNMLYAINKDNPIQVATDWPLLGITASALLSFIMLFVPWATSSFGSENAFGPNMMAAGPALIIVMVVAILVLDYGALSTRRSSWTTGMLIPVSILLAIYLIKVVDVSDLANIYAVVGASGASAGPGVWLGFIFALVTSIFAVVAYLRCRQAAAEPTSSGAGGTGPSGPSPEGRNRPI